jgi:hypothetical protein
LGHKAKWEHFRAVYERYRKAGREAKQVTLNEFRLNSGYNRKYAIRLLNGPPPLPGKVIDESWNAFTRGESAGQPESDAGKPGSARTNEKTHRSRRNGCGKAAPWKSPKPDFPPSLQIAQKARDSHFPTAATAAGLRLHFQCLDDRHQGYIFKWLDAPGR